MIKEGLFILESNISSSISIKFLHLRLNRLVEDIINSLQFLFLLLYNLLRLHLSLVVVSRSRSLFNHSQKL